MDIKSYEDLEVWQKSILLLDAIYTITESFPDKERFRLIDQMCRAAISIPSNIAEGSSRKSTKEFTRYIAIALGSLAELRTQMHIAFIRNYIVQNKYEQFRAETDLLGKKLNALYNSLEKRL